MTELVLIRGVQGLGAGMIVANIFATLAAIGAALIMPNLRLEEHPAPARDATEASPAAPIPETVAQKS